MRKSGLIGPHGHQLVRVKDRVAPRPHRRAGLEGWVRWGLVGRDGREVRGGEQHNLILNTMLDDIASRMLVSGTSAAFFFSHFAVGTGSTPPDVSDASLAAQVGARATTLIEATVNRTADGVYELVVEREFGFSEGNGNLTEFGFAGGATTDILVRELFRDSNGDPITITKTSDYKLRIRYTLTVTLAPVLATPASFTITGIGLVEGNIRWHGASNASSGANSWLDLKVFSRTAAGTVSVGLSSGAPDPYTATSGALIPSGYRGEATPSAYSPGAYTRSVSGLWNTAQGNLASVKTIAATDAAGGGNNHYPGFMFVIDEDDRFEKDDLHTLSIEDVLTVTWGRA